MSGKVWLGTGALVVVLAGSVVAYRALHPPAHVGGHVAAAAGPAVTPAGTGQDVEQLRAELALVQNQLFALRDRVSEEKASAPVTAPPPEPEALDPVTLRQRREEAEQQHKDHMAEVAANFEQEPVDRRFATTARAAVDQVIKGNPVLAAAVGETDCRSHTCRVEIHDAKGADVSKQLPIFLNQVGTTLPNMQADHIDEENGQTTAVLFLTDEQPVARAPAK